ncbi:MAG: acyl-CoA dehydrogenase [Ilumatobacter sp.]|jgi:alkylation response protein AidB-like acyl-CoA dehydrogenase|uniref:acyl-CoA dehydrogenase family protein n=1 Tax=Ilumatobacter sp. TaxID=1967498 RepID=UPI001DA2A3B2|nr:acyl-CoA dehydrogenase [Ilumatobacter sp.]MBT5278027.1 acyl-CoA dehydrogenase [Ilumatobacter sp.]MBT5554914.1 acyl-CoA dehydrogenase [Ilumatobacter sp.]MBT5866877.1 acyl-CoA dehydrogenase [Ilumatobacter sp.]MBT7429643.1 acyl-CoA dehydrogenase [Ilumatobacter sp.]
MNSIYDETHELFRESFRAFVDAEIVPKYPDWEAAGIMDRELYVEAGKHGFVGMSVAEEHGGGGTTDFRFNAIIADELARRGINGAGLGLTLHNDIVTPYFIEYCNEEQAARWLPGIASGELITAVAMTEPGTGSDLAGIKTTAVRDGDEFVLNGAKTFITNGINSDLVVVVCMTDAEAGRNGMTLLVVERGMEGFERGRNLDKIGQKSADTAELFFADVRVPAANVLGEEGNAMEYLAFNLAQERLSIGLFGVAAARSALEWTVEYVKERTAFGQPIASFQNTKFVLAEVATEIAVAEPFMEQCILKLNEGTLSPATAAMAKLHGTELQNRVTDRCLQLFGGYGFMTEYPIGPAYADARVTTIYGGTSEIMKTIISKDVLK